jgi:ubiquinone/menaquinone biosynthesis C-methylase UbiE
MWPRSTRGDTTVGRILDVACGPGVLAPVLGPRAEHLVGLDLTAETLRLARERSEVEHVSWVRGLAGAAPFAAGSFDAAVVRLALHHFEDPGAVLSEVRRLLRVGGRLVVLDVLTSEDEAIAELHNAIERLRDPSHASFMAAPAHCETIRGTGFEITDEARWETPRRYTEWAQIISDPVRMDALEVMLRHLSRAGIDGGIALREENGTLWFTYRWHLVTADAI